MQVLHSTTCHLCGPHVFLQCCIVSGCGGSCSKLSVDMTCPARITSQRPPKNSLDRFTTHYAYLSDSNRASSDANEARFFALCMVRAPDCPEWPSSTEMRVPSIRSSESQRSTCSHQALFTICLWKCLTTSMVRKPFCCSSSTVKTVRNPSCIAKLLPESQALRGLFRI